jgi:hypothetical protein
LRVAGRELLIEPFDDVVSVMVSFANPDRSIEERLQALAGFVWTGFISG